MEEVVYHVEVLLPDETVWVDLLVGDGFVEAGDAYVDENARCMVCGRLMFRPEDDEDDDSWDTRHDECGGSYEYDYSQHPVELFLEEWMHERYGPDAELGGFGAGHQLKESPCMWPMLKERVLKHHPWITDEQFDEMSHDDLRALLPPDEREEVLAEAERWMAEVEALSTGRETSRASERAGILPDYLLEAAVLAAGSNGETLRELIIRAVRRELERKTRSAGCGIGGTR